MKGFSMWLSNKFVRALFVGIVSVQLISCGTLIYPERRGQRTGHLDVGVVLMDTIGLFFFIIPGVVAFAVDFSTGAIYLPDEKNTTKCTSISNNLRVVKFRRGHLTPQKLEALLRKEIGRDVHLGDTRLKIVRLPDKRDMQTYFAEAQKSNVVEIALLK